MKRVALSEVKDQLSKTSTKRSEKRSSSPGTAGRPAGVLIGFEGEDDWFDYQLENDPAFLRRIRDARERLRAGEGVRLEDLPES
jgi:hypothetical protein